MTLLKPETLDALGDFAVGCVAISSKTLGLPDPSAAFSLFKKGRSVLRTLSDEGRMEATVALQFRDALEAEWVDWGRLGELPDEYRKKAVDDADIVLPSVLPTAQDIVSEYFDVSEILKNTLDRAAVLMPNAYEDRGPQHADTWHSRRFLSALIEKTCAELVRRPEWFAMITPELFTSVFSILCRLEEGQAAALAGQKAILAGQDAARAQMARIEEIVLRQASERSGLTLSQAQGLLAAFGHQEIEADPDRIVSLIAGKADEQRELVEKLRRLDDGDPEVAALRSAAADRIGDGDYEGAKAALEDAERRDREVEEALEQRLRARRDNRIRSLSDLGDLAYLRFDYPEAVQRYAEASDLVDPKNVPLLWSLQFSRAQAYYMSGIISGDSSEIEAAASLLYSKVILDLSPDAHPVEWAMTKDFLALLLAQLPPPDGTVVTADCIRAHFSPSIELLREAIEALDKVSGRGIRNIKAQICVKLAVLLVPMTPEDTLDLSLALDRRESANEALLNALREADSVLAKAKAHWTVEDHPDLWARTWVLRATALARQISGDPEVPYNVALDALAALDRAATILPSEADLFQKINETIAQAFVQNTDEKDADALAHAHSDIFGIPPATCREAAVLASAQLRLVFGVAQRDPALIEIAEATLAPLLPAWPEVPIPNQVDNDRERSLQMLDNFSVHRTQSSLKLARGELSNDLDLIDEAIFAIRAIPSDETMIEQVRLHSEMELKLALAGALITRARLDDTDEGRREARELLLHLRENFEANPAFGTVRYVDEMLADLA